MLALDLSEGESIALDQRMLRFLRLFFVASLWFSLGWFLGVGLPVAFEVAPPLFSLFFCHQDRTGDLSIDAITAVNSRQRSNRNINPFPILLTVLSLYMFMLDIILLLLLQRSPLPPAHLLDHTGYSQQPAVDLVLEERQADAFALEEVDGFWVGQQVDHFNCNLN